MESAPRDIKTILIVEDQAPLRVAIAKMLRSSGTVVLEAGTEQGALALLSPPPDLLICDVFLPDGSAIKILEAALGLSPEPLRIAMSGNASAKEAFRLAQEFGVRAYLQKPFALAQVTEAIERVRCEAPRVDEVISGNVGKVPMRELQQRVRDVMVGEALARERGNLSRAAKLLDVTRQAIQHITRSG